LTAPLAYETLRRCSGSPKLTIPCAPGPQPPWCWQSSDHSHERPTPKGRDSLSRGLQTPQLPTTRRFAIFLSNFYVMIGRALRPFPHPKPGGQVSLHRAFQSWPMLLQEGRPAGTCRGTHQAVLMARHLPFPSRSVNSCLDATAGIPFAMQPVAS
jgi:hypothetical protein